MDVFKDLLRRASADGVYTGVYDDAMVVTAFCRMLNTPEAVEAILTRYLGLSSSVDSQLHPLQRLMHALFPTEPLEKLLPMDGRPLMIPTSRVTDVAERLHARICTPTSPTIPRRPSGQPLGMGSELDGGRVRLLEQTLTEMCRRTQEYVKQMEQYSLELERKNSEILALHQGLADQEAALAPTGLQERLQLYEQAFDELQGILRREALADPELPYPLPIDLSIDSLPRVVQDSIHALRRTAREKWSRVN